MDLIKTEGIFHVNQRVAGKWDGQMHWRVGMTISAPVAIDYRSLIGLAMQLGLTEPDVAAVVDTEAFPAQLRPPGQPPCAPIHAQWAYKPAVAALLALGETKLNGSGE